MLELRNAASNAARFAGTEHFADHGGGNCPAAITLKRKLSLSASERGSSTGSHIA
jgi:hypothetical protein